MKIFEALIVALLANSQQNCPTLAKHFLKRRPKTFKVMFANVTLKLGDLIDGIHTRASGFHFTFRTKQAHKL